MLAKELGLCYGQKLIPPHNRFAKINQPNKGDVIIMHHYNFLFEVYRAQ